MSTQPGSQPPTAERHDPDHTGPAPDANSAIEADLRPRYRTALRKLDDDAHHAEHLLKNPSDADIRRMFADGLLPLEALVLYPTITLTRDEAARALRLFDPPELGTPLEVLQLRLDLARSLGLDPRDYAQLLQVYWQSKALKDAGLNILDDWDITLGAPALSDIIEKVYDYYGELFEEEPQHGMGRPRQPRRTVLRGRVPRPGDDARDPAEVPGRLRQDPPLGPTALSVDP